MELHLDLHTGWLPTQSDYTRSCTNTIVLLRMQVKVDLHLDLHTGWLPTQSDYTRSCINTNVLLRMITGFLKTCRGFK